MADLVENVLRAALDRESKYKTIEVEKDIDLDIDVGNLLVSDPNPIDLKKFRANTETFLQALARDNTQLLVNSLWQLPTEKIEDVIIVKLPDPQTLLPREKRLPKAKSLTKWDEYARMKGINNKKKSRKAWDEARQEWKPKWGYKRANDELADWVIEVPANADPNEDQFEKRKKAKNERMAKNELQRLRNIARSHKSKVPGVGLTPTDNPSKDHVSKALTVARKSTASIGKFTTALRDEKTSRHGGKKRKFESNYGNIKSETKRQLGILDNIANKQPRLDVSQVLNKHVAEEQQARAVQNKAFGKKKKGKNKKFAEKDFKIGKKNKLVFKGNQSQGKKKQKGKRKGKR